MTSRLVRFGSISFAFAMLVGLVAPMAAAQDDDKSKATDDSGDTAPKKRRKKVAADDDAAAAAASSDKPATADATATTDTTDDEAKPKKRRRPRKSDDDEGEEEAAPKPAPKPVTPPRPDEPGPTDHSRHVGHFGIGYEGAFGASVFDVAALTGGGTQTTLPLTAVNTPLVGVRYWLQPNLGIDVALGFNNFGGSVTTNTSSTSTTTNLDSAWAFSLKAGVPISFYEGTHYLFFVEPQVLFSHASGTHHPADPNAPNDSLSGTHLAIGATAGAEISFGFIGIPMLSLDATVGLALDYTSSSVDFGDKTNINDASYSQTTLATSVQGSPWNIFTSSIAARYYF